MTSPSSTAEGARLEAARKLARRLRLVGLAFVLAWFLSETLRLWIPVWLPFLVTLSIEVQFLAAGLRAPLPPTLVDSAEWGPGLKEKDFPDQRDRDLGFELDPESSDTALLDFVDPRTGEENGFRARHRRLVLTLETAAVLCVLGLILWLAPASGWNSLNHARQAAFETRLSSEASRLAGHKARVSCDTSYRHVGYTHDADGLAYVGGKQAYLTPEICYSLYRLSRGHVDSFDRTSWALVVLGHESAHLRGVSSESQAECSGIQDGIALGIRFGLSAAAARHMMAFRLTEDAFDHADAPAYLVGPSCRLPAQ